MHLSGAHVMMPLTLGQHAGRRRVSLVFPDALISASGRADVVRPWVHLRVLLKNLNGILSSCGCRPGCLKKRNVSILRLLCVRLNVIRLPVLLLDLF